MENERDLHREALLQLLDAYRRAHPGEERMTRRIERLVDREPRCFERDCFAPGHITASSWILSPDDGKVLLTHHRKLGRWLQLGGHADGDGDVRAVALREACEESGMQRFECLDGLGAGRASRVLDVDVHRIPARGDEPAHEHHDIRFLLRADAGQPLVCSDESNALRWFRRDELRELGLDESVARLWRKADTLLGGEGEESRTRS